MTKTKIDNFGVLLIIIATVCSTGLLIWMIYEWLAPQKSIGLPQRVFFTALSGLVTPLIWRIEIPKLKSLKIDNDRIIIQNLLTKTRREIQIDTVDGLKITSKWAKGGPVYEITIVVNKIQFHKISSNYIKNYDTIRAELKKRLTILSTEEFEHMRSVVKEKIGE